MSRARYFPWNNHPLSLFDRVLKSTEWASLPCRFSLWLPLVIWGIGCWSHRVGYGQGVEPNENAQGTLLYGTDARGQNPYSTPLPNASNPGSLPSQPPGNVPQVADVRFDRSVQMTTAATAADNQIQDYRQGRLLAIVGQERILDGDIAPMVDPILIKNKDKIPASQWDATREKVMHNALRDHNYPQVPRPDNSFAIKSAPNRSRSIVNCWKRIVPKLYEGFYTEQVPHLMKDLGVESELELDKKLRETGSSLAAQQRLFQDRVLAQQAIKQNVPDKPRIQKQDLEEYYEQHADQWNRPARARWLQMSVLFRNHGSKEEAQTQIAEMGNSVFTGAKFEAVAKKKSEAWNASSGGLFDWTTQGALKSSVLDREVFQLPLNRMSKIVEDEEGYHILMVLEREEASVQTFAESQSMIREQLIEAHESKALDEFIEKARQETAIWTIWP